MSNATVGDTAIEPSGGTAGGDGNDNGTMGVSGLVIGLAFISVVLRFYTRSITRQGFKLDDWFILLALLFTLVTAALLLWGNAIDPMGTWVSENTNPAYVDTSEDIFYLKLAFATSILYFTIAGTTKLGVLLMYHRIFYVSTLFRYQLFVTGFLVIGYWIGCTVAAFTNCIPLQWSWLNSLADPRYCFNYNIFWTAAGACEIVLDVLILLLPISTVLRMMLSVREKLIVVGIFLLGGFVIVTGILKVYMGYVPGGRVPSYSKTELWTTVHTGMSIVCASLPIFKPLFMRIAKSPFIIKLSTIIGARYSIKGSSRSWSFHFKSPKTSSNESRGGGRRGSAPGDMMMARGHQPPLLNNNSRRYDSAIERAVEEGLARILPPRELEEQQSEIETQKSASNSKLPPLETSDDSGLLDDIQRALQERGAAD